MNLALFDIDGTLVDAGGSGRAALCRAFERVFAVGDMASRVADVPFQGATDMWILSQFSSRAGIEPEDFAGRRRELESAYLEILAGVLREEIRPRVLPGVHALLDRLAAGGVRLGLVTGNLRRGARVKLDAVGLAERFQEGGFGEDSPDRAVLARLARQRIEALSEEAIDPAGVLLVGDSREDIRAARVNGYRSIAVGTGWTSLAELKAEGPHLALEDLSRTAEIASWLGLAA